MSSRFIAVNEYEEIIVSTNDGINTLHDYVAEFFEGENEETYSVYVLVDKVYSTADKIK